MNVEITVNTKGLDLTMEVMSKLDPIVRNAASRAQAFVQLSMVGRKSGRLYKVGRKSRRGKRKTHRASAPGEAPAVETGNLRKNILVRPMAPAVWEVYVGQNAIAYALALEYGNPRRGLAPRPYMRPGMERARRPFVSAIQKLIREATKP